VGIPSHEKRIHDFPHQMSGGMRQRVMIAIALSCQPNLLLADEPTTALDVTIQAQILELIQELKQRIGTSIILITHNLGVIAETATHVIVMYGGKMVEHATMEDLFENTSHPYTQGLLKSIPNPDENADKLHVIPGVVPSLLDPPTGCLFSDRCGRSSELKRCVCEEPPLFEIRPGHQCRCWLYA
jgi:oligopeptide/dipeptide ABC transporter ATP-binding protein